MELETRGEMYIWSYMYVDDGYLSTLPFLPLISTLPLQCSYMVCLDGINDNKPRQRQLH